MNTVVPGPSLTSLAAGDPERLGPAAASMEDLATALGRPGLARAVPVALAPDVALVRDEEATGLAVTWAILPHGPLLGPDGLRAKLVVVLEAPLDATASALRVAARLAACLASGDVRARLVGARSRQDLVEALGPAQARASDVALDDQALFVLLGSDARGLNAGEAARRLAACGTNEVHRGERRSLAWRLAAQLTSFFAVLLWIGGALAFLVSSPEAGWAIFGVIVLNSVFSFFQEYRAERAVDALEALLPRRIGALRSGAIAEVDVAAVVPGDIVQLAEGDHVPADGRVIEAAGLRVDQSALTGEAQPVFKLPLRGDGRENVPRFERSGLVFAGTCVVAGAATVLVTATGMETEIGAIAGLTESVGDGPSPLQRELARATRVVTALAVGIGASAFVLSVATGRLALGQALLFALGVIVANVPEGLLPPLSLALALAVQRLARAGTLMKRLSAV